MLIDAHTHIQFPAFDADRDAAIVRAREAGVQMIAVGTQIGTSRDAVARAHEYPKDMWATVGFHPGHAVSGWHYDKNEQREARQERFDAAALRELAEDKKVVAIGECGLDYYRLIANREAQIARQKKVFLAQVAIAEELKKPLMIHCRPSQGTDDAYEDLLQIAKSKEQIAKIVHFYVGSPTITKRLLDAGFYFTFGGVITFSEKLAELKGVSAEEIARRTAETAGEAFRLS